MGALDALYNNPVAPILAMESDLPYVRDITMFFYTLSILNNNNSGANFLSTFVLTFVRAFGAIGIALPLVLGGLPGDVLKDLDHNCLIVFAAMFWNLIGVQKKLNTKAVNMFFDYCEKIAYSIVKANVCSQGCEAARGALGGSFWAPFVGSYLAVQGHLLVENGINAINKNTFDEDGLLGVFGGVWVWVGANHLDIVGPMSRVCLAFLHFSNDFIDWSSYFADFLNKLDEVVSNVGTGSGARRSRSRTPTRKNK